MRSVHRILCNIYRRRSRGRKIFTIYIKTVRHPILSLYINITAETWQGYFGRLYANPSLSTQKCFEINSIAIICVIPNYLILSKKRRRNATFSRFFFRHQLVDYIRRTCVPPDKCIIRYRKSHRNIFQKVRTVYWLSAPIFYLSQ